MEELWKDINLAALQENPGSTITSNINHSAFPSTILQDFLSKPFVKDQTSKVVSPTFFNSIELPPATALSLELVSNPKLQSQASVVTGSSGSFVIQNLTTLVSSTVSPCISKKRPEKYHENTGDRRHKRMIKNRESAARSRARKQSYTNQLEREVARLEEENAKLTKQQKKLLAARKQLPEKHRLQRTSTAPF